MRSRIEKLQSAVLDPEANDERVIASEDFWPTPLPLGRSVPPFPALDGSIVTKFALELAEETQSPVDLSGVISLATLSAAMQGRVMLSPDGIHMEPVNIYAAVALPSGSMKSSVVSRTSAPVHDYEQAGEAEGIAAQAAARAERSIAESRAKQAALAAAKETDDEKRTELTAEAARLASEAETKTIPPVRRLLFGDTTPEKLSSLLAENGGRLAVLSSEAGLFGDMAGRRNAGANYEVHLAGWSGDSIKIDRMTRSETIPRPSLTIGLSVQPSVLRDIGADAGFRGRGVLARFLWSMPTPTLGYRNVRSPKPMSQSTLREWRALVTRMAGTFGEGSETTSLQLDPAAREAFIGWWEALELRCRPGADLAANDDLRQMAGKMHGQLMRLAGILHVAENLTTGYGAKAISLDTMVRATELADYFLAHGIAVYEYMNARGGLGDAEAVLDWVRVHTRGEETFSRRDLHSALRSRFSKVELLKPVLEMLDEYGYLRPLDPGIGPKGGRPPIRYAVNPNVYTQHTKPTTKGTGATSTRGFAGSVSTSEPPRSSRPTSAESPSAVSPLALAEGLGPCCQCSRRPGLRQFHGKDGYWCRECFEPAHARALTAVGHPSTPMEDLGAFCSDELEA